MRREELKELHYITHVENVASICKRGVLSNRLAARLQHRSVADPEVQERRKGKPVPGGFSLHSYANLYITARNPMLFKRIRDGQIDELCVVSVSTDVLDLRDVVVTDRNAAKFGCGFSPANTGIDAVDAELIQRPYWTDGDQLEQDRCWNAKFTEVLVPNRVDPGHVQGVYVAGAAARSVLDAQGLPIQVRRNRNLFFNES